MLWPGCAGFNATTNLLHYCHAARADFIDCNPYGNWSEGANWLKEAEAGIDFCCIHPYWDQWTGFKDTPEKWLE
jgi:hypothetical protein